MDLMKKRKDAKSHFKKEKKLKKLISISESDSEESEHELSHYLNDRVKLMKEVLKIIKPKKIKTMAPNCMKNLDQGEINSMLLEELLGISNKRLKYIFNGQNLEEDSSSTDPEVEQQPIDVISLDDISDDDFVIDLDSENDTEKKQHKKHNKPKIKEECRRKKIKKEKQDKSDSSKSSKKSKEPNHKMDEQNLMSVLELLELQARARAIRSQLALENNKKSQESEKNETKTEYSDNDDAIIIESPKNIEIIITSSESENEDLAGISSKSHKDISEKRNSSEENRTKKESSDLGKLGTKEKESLIESTGNVSNEKNYNTQNTGNTNVNLEIKRNKQSHCDSVNKNNDMEMFYKSSLEQEDKPCSESKNKITNIETVIITPAKNILSVVADTNIDNVYCETNEKSEGNKMNNEKSDESETGKANMKNEKPTLPQIENIKSNAKDESSKIESYEESDGIIINMEQSEIDCIISD